MNYRFVRGRVERFRPAPVLTERGTTMIEKEKVKGAAGPEGERSTLNLKQMMRLVHILLSRKDRYTAERPMKDAVCKELSQEVGHPVSESNLKTALGAAEYNWVSRTTRVRVGGRYGGGMKFRLAVLERQVDSLRHALLTLCERWGEAVPPQIREGEWVSAPDRNDAEGEGR